MAEKLRNVPASVRQRLLNLARERKGEFNQLLGSFALERLLYRMSVSEYAEQFVLKGALLFLLWSDTPQRPTRDADFLGTGPAEPQRLVETFRALARMDSPELRADGLVFLEDRIEAGPIRAATAYPGITVTLAAELAGARIPLQCDIGFGDAVTPAPERKTLPVLLPLPAPTLRVYPPETVVAEKLEAIVKLGSVNSRVKDYFDLWVLFTHGKLDRELLPVAVAATFARRGTAFPDGVPEGLGEVFVRTRESNWHAFVRRNALTVPPFSEVVAELRERCLPLMHAARDRSR